TTEDGLAHNHINAIRQDPRGYLWFCSDGGLSRFDGYGFTTYTIRDGLPHSWVNDILFGRDGSYWVATDGGVCRYTTSGAQRFTVSLPSPREGAQRVNSLIEDKDGNIWCGTYDGVYRMKPAASNGVTFNYVEIGYPRQMYEASLVNSILI